MSRRPLEGLKVADLSWVVAGPSMTRVLADFGATVVRVESGRRPDTARVMQPFHNGEFGVESSALYGTCNAGKMDLGLDLGTDEGRQIVRDLAMWADVLVESFSPGTLAKWGLDTEGLRRANPRLICLSSSLMGQSGPLSNLAGFGNIGASVSGFQALVGHPEELPTGPYGPYTDYVAPKLALVAVLGAFIRRDRTGEGCVIDVSQVEAGLFFLSPQLMSFAAGEAPARAQGNRDTRMAPHGVYPCLSHGELDSYIAIAIDSDRAWEGLLSVIDRPDLKDDEKFVDAAARREHQDEIDVLIEEWTSTRLVADAEASLQHAGVPAYAAVPSIDYPTDPQIRAWGHLVELDHPLFGTTTVEGPRFHLSETPGTPSHAAPMIGADSIRVLSELLGYPVQRIEELREAGVIEVLEGDRTSKREQAAQ